MLAKHALSQLSYGPFWVAASGGWRIEGETIRHSPFPIRVPIRVLRLVGLGGLEPPTSRLSSARSNQLSYKPLTTRSVLRAWPLARVRPRRKRNEDGEIPPMELNDLAIDGP